MNRRGFRRAALGVAVAVVGSLVVANTASADSMTPIGSFSDPRTDMPSRAGSLVRGIYGPYTVPANSEVHNAINTNALVPCNDLLHHGHGRQPRGQRPA